MQFNMNDKLIPEERPRNNNKTFSNM